MCTTSGQVNAIWSMICVTKRPCDSADWCQVGDPTSSRISRSQGLYKKNRVARKPGQVCREPQGPGPIVFPFHDMGRSLQCFGGTSIFHMIWRNFKLCMSTLLFWGMEAPNRCRKGKGHGRSGLMSRISIHHQFTVHVSKEMFPIISLHYMFINILYILYVYTHMIYVCHPSWPNVKPSQAARPVMWDSDVDFDLAAFHTLVRALKRALSGGLGVIQRMRE